MTERPEIATRTVVLVIALISPGIAGLLRKAGSAPPLVPRDAWPPYGPREE